MVNQKEIVNHLIRIPGNINTGTGDRGRALISLFQPYNPDTQIIQVIPNDT